MRRREFLGAASLGFLQAPDRAGFSRSLGGSLREKPGVILASRRSSDSLVVISPDGRWVATAERDCSFKVSDGATGRLVWMEPSPRGLVRSMAFTPDSRRLVIGGRGVPMRHTMPPSFIPSDDEPAIVRDDYRRILDDRRMDAVINAHSRQVKVLNLVTKKLITLADTHDGAPVEYVFAAGDSSVLAIDTSARITRWDFERADDFRLIDLPRRPGESVLPTHVSLD